MSWDSVLGHDDVRQQFATAVAQQRLASTFLFLGPEGIGKRRFAKKLAETLLCPRAVDFQPCGQCPSCKQMRAGEHPDLEYVRRLPEKNQITLEQLIGDKANAQGLCQRISMKPYYGGRRIAILDDADDLRQEGANALLKTLEEPPPGAVILLIGTAEQRQLPTIRSRCQIIRFAPLDWNLVQRILVEQDLVSPPDMAERLARASGGSVQRALQLFGEEVLEFRDQWLEQLASCRVTANDFPKTLLGFVDRAGKDAVLRRRRLMEVAVWAADYYRLAAAAWLIGPQASALRDHPDHRLVELAQQGAQRWPGTAAGWSWALDRCLMIEPQVMANVHLTTLVETWLLDLNQCAAGRVPAIGSLTTASPLATP